MSKEATKQPKLSRRGEIEMAEMVRVVRSRSTFMQSAEALSFSPRLFRGKTYVYTMSYSRDFWHGLTSKSAFAIDTSHQSVGSRRSQRDRSAIDEDLSCLSQMALLSLPDSRTV